MTIAHLSAYPFGALAFLMLTVMLWLAWWKRRSHAGLMLILACAATAVSCAVNGLSAVTSGAAWSVSFASGAIQAVAWIGFFSNLIARGSEQDPHSVGQRMWLSRYGFSVLGLLILVAIISLVVVGSAVVGSRLFNLASSLGQIALGVIGLVAIEQLYRNADSQARWRLKYLCVGAAGLFGYEVFIFSHAIVNGGLNSELWIVRGYTTGLIAPFIAVAGTRNPDWSTRIFVSRHVVYHSTTVLAVGVYLVLMSAAAYAIQYFGGSWGRVGQVAFAFIGIMAMVLLLSSGQLRSRLKVFIAKHFFQNQYDYREEWLRCTSILSDSQDSRNVSQATLLALCSPVGSGGGRLWRRDRGGELALVLRQGVGPDHSTVPISKSAPVIEFLERTGWIIDLNEVADNSAPYGDLGLPDDIRADSGDWLLVPLLHGESLEGMACLKRSESRRQINWEDRDLLKTIARQAASYLALDNASDELAEAKQFEAFNRLSAFVVHDLKNLVAQLSLIGANAKRHMDNPEFVRDAFMTVDNATSRMNRLLTQLRKGEAGDTGTNMVHLKPVVEKVCRIRSQQMPAPSFSFSDRGAIVSVDPGRLSAVIEHLVQNAQDATPEDGKVNVAVSTDSETVSVSVTDTGAGMAREFVENRLFKPFETTKGNAGMGIGAYESREFCRENGGSLTVESKPGRGSTFTVILPLADADGATVLQTESNVA